MKSWIAKAIRNAALWGRLGGHRATPWSRWIPGTPTVEPERFQDTDDPAPGHWMLPPAPWPESPAELAASRGRLRRAMDELPDMWRAVVVARDVQGRTAEEVATELGITPEDQLPLLHRARAALRTSLADHFDQRTSGSGGPEDSS